MGMRMGVGTGVVRDGESRTVCVNCRRAHGGLESLARRRRKAALRAESGEPGLLGFNRVRNGMLSRTR
jgi:hypothetical protein